MKRFFRRNEGDCCTITVMEEHEHYLEAAKKCYFRTVKSLFFEQGKAFCTQFPPPLPLAKEEGGVNNYLRERDKLRVKLSK